MTMKMQELASPLFLSACFSSVLARSPVAGRDGVSPAHYQKDLSSRLERLSRAMQEGTFRPAPLLRLRKRKQDGGERNLAIPSVEERIVLEALHRGLAPRVEPLLSEAAHAYRPGRSARGAVEAIQKQIDHGNGWVFTADIRNFFDTILTSAVRKALEPLVEDRSVMDLIALVLHRHELLPGRGLAQGSSLSPLLSNLILTPLDRRLRAAGHPLVRYSDNLCCTARSQSAAKQALELIEQELASLKMALKPGETRICRASEGFLWLGFWVTEDGLQASEGAIQALRERLTEAAQKGAEGTSLRERLLPVLRGWSAYFRAPLPLSVTLGPQDALARQLLDELAGTRSAQEPAGTSPGATDGDPAASWDGLEEAGSEEDEEPWTTAAPADEPAQQELRADVEAMFQEAERLASIGEYLQAEQLHEEAEHRRKTATEAPLPVPAEAPEPSVEEEAVDAFLGLFCAGQERVELAPVGTPGAREFEHHERPPRPRDVRRHLAGQAAMAILPRLPDGTCTLGVIDLDARQGEQEESVAAFAQALVVVAMSRGLQCLVEHTGGRGIHLWIPVDEPVSADLMHRLLRSLLLAAGSPSEGVRVELLPAPQEAVDLHQQSITLPLGIHVESVVPSRLRWGDGIEVTRDLLALFRPPSAADLVRAATPPELPSLLASVGLAPGVAPEPPRIEAPAPRSASPGRALPLLDGPRSLAWISEDRKVGAVLEGCAVLRHLAQKAEATGHLDHAERLSLLYSMGHMGPAGEQAIHAIVRRCRNYREAETSRQLARRTGLPISCHRLRDKHATEGALKDACSCDFGDIQRRGGYATPLLHGMGFRALWRDTLHGRKERVSKARREGVPGVVVITSPASEALEGPRQGVPPHEWA